MGYLNDNYLITNPRSCSSCGRLYRFDLLERCPSCSLLTKIQGHFSNTDIDSSGGENFGSLINEDKEYLNSKPSFIESKAEKLV